MNVNVSAVHTVTGTGYRTLSETEKAAITGMLGDQGDYGVLSIDTGLQHPDGPKYGTSLFLLHPSVTAHLLANLSTIANGYTGRDEQLFDAAYADASKQLDECTDCTCGAGNDADEFEHIRRSAERLKKVDPSLGPLIDSLIDTGKKIREKLDSTPAGNPSGLISKGGEFIRASLKNGDDGRPAFMRIDGIGIYCLHPADPETPDPRTYDEHGVPTRVRIGEDQFDLVRMVPDGGEGGSADDEPADRDTADTQEYPDGIGGPCIDHSDVREHAGDPQ